MALTVEDGTGLAGADAYISLAEFRAFRIKHYVPADSVPDDELEQAVRRGTRYLDGRFRGRFLGFRTNGFLQSLEWPRMGVVLPWGSDTGVAGLYYGRGYSSSYGDFSPGTALAANVVPSMLKDATCEAAIRELASPGSLTPDQTPAKRVIRQTVGPISTEYANVLDTRPTITLIDELLAPLLSRTSAYSGSVVRA